MTGDHSLLTGFEKRACPGMTFGDDNKGYTLGYGKIKKENVIIEKVALVDRIKHNLLSISQLCDNGNKVHFSQEASFIANKETGDILLTGNRKGNVYIADFKSSKVDSLTCLLSKASVDDSWIWHKKLSHLNFKAMNFLVQRDLVRDLPNKEFTKDGICDSCQKGKQRKASFRSKSISSIDEPLMLLHMDLFGHANIMSISKKKYALVIVDDFTRFSWTFFLHSQDEANQLIINRIKNVETRSKWKVAKIRSDNETEFKNSSMRVFCESKGISKTFSASRTPQQNGVVERKNRTLIEAARTMLEDYKLPTYFWVEAIIFSYFTQNLSIINHA